MDARLTLIGLLAIVSAARAASDVEQRIDRIRDGLLPAVLVKGEPPQSTKLAERMAKLHIPAVSIAVIHAGKLEWARGFGVERVGGPPVSPETLFQAASISKTVTTVAALRVVHDGKLSLDTDVNQYLTTWRLPSNEFTQNVKVTLRGLLTHSAGV
ncbi:MAG: beta-lactamase family protein, partial [Sinobacteraceae bacterium]|nr:beta-lactamase family protein [Nevskiaceae bacterium]